ncbi:MAG TPA: hypothetical protein EYN13_07540 [Methylococcales bacterium]|nr:hypothetical protein [Methylococcales bacterium]
MSLVKFETDSDIDFCIEGIKLAYPNVNTGAAAAKHALLNYQACVEKSDELFRENVRLSRLLSEARAALRLNADAEFNMTRVLNDLDEYLTKD